MVGFWMASLRRPSEAKADKHQRDQSQPRYQRRLGRGRPGPGEAGPGERDGRGRARPERQVPPAAAGVRQRDGERERGQREQWEWRGGRGREQRAPGALQSSRCGTEEECHEVLVVSVGWVFAVVPDSPPPLPSCCYSGSVQQAEVAAHVAAVAASLLHRAQLRQAALGEVVPCVLFHRHHVDRRPLLHYGLDGQCAPPPSLSGIAATCTETATNQNKSLVTDVNADILSCVHLVLEDFINWSKHNSWIEIKIRKLKLPKLYLHLSYKHVKKYCFKQRQNLP